MSFTVAVLMIAILDLAVISGLALVSAIPFRLDRGERAKLAEVHEFPGELRRAA